MGFQVRDKVRVDRVERKGDKSHSVQVLVDVLRNRADLAVEFFLNLEQVGLVVFSDEVDGDTEMSKTTRSTDSVEMGLCILREIEVDDNIHTLDVDTSCEKISANQASSLSILEVMIDTISVALLHL